MFYLVCVLGIFTTLIAMVVAIRSPKRNTQLIVFNEDNGGVYRGDHLITTYRKGGKNYRLLTALSEIQGTPITREELSQKVQFTVDSKCIANLRLPCGVIVFDDNIVCFKS